MEKLKLISLHRELFLSGCPIGSFMGKRAIAP
jgi:hypothetical protein